MVKIHFEFLNWLMSDRHNSKRNYLMIFGPVPPLLYTKEQLLSGNETFISTPKKQKHGVWTK